MAKNTHIKACDFIQSAPEGLPGFLVSDYPARERAARIIAVGDTCVGGRVAQRHELDLPLCLEEVHEAFEQADLVFANLEGVLIDEPEKESQFTGSVDMADAIREAGVGVANLANNHSFDQGQVGLESTAQALTGRGITVVGAGPNLHEAASLVRSDVGDLRVGWLAAGRTGEAPGPDGWQINELDPDAIVQKAREARDYVDCLIVSLHTGFMFVDYPHPETRDLARKLAAAGACLILMHHPHVLQGVEVFENGTVVCYSLGNFLFDWQAGNIPTAADEGPQREGALFCFDLDPQGVISAVLVPTIVDDDLNVQWPNPERASEILNRVERLSEALAGTDWEQEFWHQRAERNTLHGIKTLWYVLRKGRVKELFRLLSRVRLQHLATLWTWVGQKTRGSG